MRRLALALALLLTPSPVVASPGYAYDKEYKIAVKLENAGDLVAALAAFEAIPESARDYNTKLHIASCKKKLGRLKEAAQDYEKIKNDPKADTPTVETAASDLEDVERRIPKIRVRLAAATTAVVVMVDGAEVKPPVDHPVNPGEHEVIAKRGAKVVYERRVTLPESAAVEVEIDAPIAATPSAQPEVPAPTPEGRPKPPSRISATPFFIGSGVLAVGAVVSFVLARSAQTDLESNCAAQKTPKCDTDLAGASRVRTWETIGWVSGGVALASLGVGIALTTRSSEPTNKTTAIVTPLVGPTVGLSVEGRF
ncbi:MAG: hypothetical protein HYV09_10840 [Deltaproteobacteria bacterium]|nr:hypothetical protein [Deltaproteobacteria bacterium]